MIRLRREFGLAAVGMLWLGAVAAGFAAWEAYDATPGDGPRDARTETDRPATGRGELVMFAHPRCPCTRASLAELGELLSHNSVGAEVRILFVRPEGVADGWERGELWATAADIPGVRVECDPGGAEAARAGATASGHVVVYDRDGRVAFRGGITKARG